MAPITGMKELEEYVTGFKFHINNHISWRFLHPDGFITDRINQPCFGGMPTVDFNGGVLAAAFPFKKNQSMADGGKYLIENNYSEMLRDFVLDKTVSPWRKILAQTDHKLFISKNMHGDGIIILDTDQPSESICNVLLALRHAWLYYPIQLEIFEHVTRKYDPVLGYFIASSVLPLSYFKYIIATNGATINSAMTNLREFRNGNFIPPNKNTFRKHPGLYYVSGNWKNNKRYVNPIYTLIQDHLISDGILKINGLENQKNRFFEVLPDYIDSVKKLEEL